MVLATLFSIGIFIFLVHFFSFFRLFRFIFTWPWTCLIISLFLVNLFIYSSLFLKSFLFMHGSNDFPSFSTLQISSQLVNPQFEQHSFDKSIRCNPILEHALLFPIHSKRISMMNQIFNNPFILQWFFLSPCEENIFHYFFLQCFYRWYFCYLIQFWVGKPVWNNVLKNVLKIVLK